MIKITKYMHKDSLHESVCHTLTIEFNNGKPTFKAIYEPEIIRVMLGEEYREQLKENYGMGVCYIEVQEQPDN